MGEITARQQEKLDRLNIITEESYGPGLFTDPRFALRFAADQKLLSGWSDYGNHYTFSFVNSKQVQVRPFLVGETIIDRFLQVKDPAQTTVLKEGSATEELPVKEPVRRAKTKVEKEIQP